MRLAEEVFYSVQGEGPYIGEPSVFVRLAGCNLKCKFCDTPYALQQGFKVTVEEVAELLSKFSCRRIVFTGGEPMLQQTELIELMEQLLRKYFFMTFEVETNGTIIPNKRMLELVDFWVISPKLSNSGNKPYKLEEWVFSESRGEKYFKFVVDNVNDLIEIQEYVKKFPEKVEEGLVFLMPQATTVEEHNKKLPFIIDFAKVKGYRVTPRLQILAYGLRKGV